MPVDEQLVEPGQRFAVPGQVREVLEPISKLLVVGDGL